MLGHYSAIFSGTSCLQTTDFCHQLLCSDFTVEGWVNVCDCVNNLNCSYIFINNVDNWSTPGYNWAIGGSGSGICFFGECGNLPYITGISTEYNKWHHFALNRINNNLLFFLNGCLVNSGDVLCASPSDSFSCSSILLGSTDNGNQTFCGLLSNVRIVKDQFLYCSNFTPPNYPLTSSGFGNISQNITGQIDLLILQNCTIDLYLNDVNAGNGYSTTYTSLNPWSGSFYQSEDICIQLPDNNCYSNGYLNTYFDGLGGCYAGEYNYCENGYSFLNQISYEYISNGNGGYRISETAIRNQKNITVDWDFSKTTKEKYYFNSIEACGSDLCLSISDSCGLFYEVNSICNTTICLSEAKLKKALYLNDVCKPFLFIRNVGTSNLLLDFSETYTFSCYKQNEVDAQVNYINTNYCLYPRQSIILTFNSYNSGELYYSSGVYPFGFFYEFDNVRDINPMGLYPSRCYLDESGNSIPLYIYKDIDNLCVSGSVVLTDNYTKQLSFYENLSVDENVNLNISLYKQTYNNDDYYIENFEVNSEFDFNCFNSSININSVLISDGISNTQINGYDTYSINVNSDKNLKLIYDIDVSCTKKYKLNYIDCYSGELNYDFCIIKNTNNETQTISREELNNNSGIIDLINNNYACIYFNLDCSSSIKDLNNLQIQRNNIFLPTINEFNYSYNFDLNRSDYLNNKTNTGYWLSGTGYLDLQKNSGFINCSFIISCDSAEYQQYKSLVCCLNLNICENRKNTLEFISKDNCNSTEAYYITYLNCESVFSYCGYCFLYYPIVSVLYNNIYYEIPNESININICTDKYCQEIPFPKNALNYDKLIVYNDFEIFDILKSSDLNIKYNDFNFNLTKNCSNYLEYQFPIIQCTGLNCIEYPSLTINNCINKFIQKDIDFKINPFNCFISDKNYGLNNYLLFVSSNLNNGAVSNLVSKCYYTCINILPSMELAFNNKLIGCYNYFKWIEPSESGIYCLTGETDFLNCVCDYYLTCNNFINFCMIYSSGDSCCSLISASAYCLSCSCIQSEVVYEYNSEEYNFLMLDLFQEYSDKYYSAPKSDWTLISQRIVTEQNNNELLSFKIKSGCLYNYILPAANNFFLCDCSSSTGILIEKNLNKLTTGITYNICSDLILNDQNFLLNICSLDIENSSNPICLEICKNYSFSGVQPINIISNYPLVNISHPIRCFNLNLYCDYNLFDETVSGTYYYIYDINNPIQCKIKIISPDETLISTISWKDDCGETIISNNSTNYINGQIQKNAAQINFNLQNMIYNNFYYYSCCNNNYICINILGGL